MCHSCPKKEPKTEYKKSAPQKHEDVNLGYECFQPRKDKGYIRDRILKKTVYICENKPNLTDVEKRFHVQPYIKCYEVPEEMLGQLDTDGTNIEIPPNVRNQLQRQNFGGYPGFPNGPYPPNFNFDPYANFQPGMGQMNNCMSQGNRQAVVDNSKIQNCQKPLSASPKNKIQMLQWKEYKEPPAPRPYRTSRTNNGINQKEPEETECYNPIPIYCAHNNPLLVQCLEERMKPSAPTNGPLPRFNPKYMCEKPAPFGKVLAHEFQREWLEERDNLREQYYPTPCPPLNIKFVSCPSIARDEKDRKLKLRIDAKPWVTNFLVGDREKDGSYFWLLKNYRKNSKDEKKTCSRNHIIG